MHRPGGGPTDVWAVGDGGTIIHFDGNRWTPSVSGTSQSLQVVRAGDVGEAWAAGRVGTILRFTKGAWRAIESGTKNHLFAISIDVDGVRAAGANGTVLRISNGSNDGR